ncbi:MAG TPA: hypothetical protein GX707_09460 [Epulopiscium sp.]|nr:hypothetical protein [Candidatus Epulonipiscium sp.]
MINIKDFGAISDGVTLNTQAIKKAINAAYDAGGGTVLIPAGKFLTGAIELKSNINLHVDAGAFLIFSNDKNEYPMITSRWEGATRSVHAACVYGQNLTNIAVTGKGTLDGQGKVWWDGRAADREYPRPKLISFDYCTDVLIDGVKLINSPFWTVNPICCENVTVNNVSILNPPNSPNTDGINPESCNNVHISNCHIDVGDDCIAIKAGTEDADQMIPCTNITITNCTMVHGHGGVVIGSEMSGDVKNVVISNCIFEGTDRGIRFKSRRGRGGVVEDIRVNNVIMKDVVSPFIMNLFYFCGPRGDEKYVWDKNHYPVTNETPSFRRIHFSNITATEVRASAGFIYGLPEMFVEDVSFDNVQILMADDAEPDVPAMLAGAKAVEGKGFYIRNAKNILFNRVSISNHTGKGFNVKDSENVEIINCREDVKYINHWSEKMAKSVMERPLTNPNKWAYEHGVILKGILEVWERTKDKKYFNYIQDVMDRFIEVDGTIKHYDGSLFNIDYINNGKLLFILFEQTGQEKYKNAAFLLRDQLKNHPRTKEGVFWHKQIYPHQIWLDGLYMGSPFYAEFVAKFGEPEEFDDITKQFIISYKHLMDSKTGLLHHAWDEQKEQFWCDPQTGLSKNYWTRSIGWYAMALVDVLDHLPTDHKDRQALINILQETINGLMKFQDKETGVWYQVTDQGNRTGNYLEASASTMIVYAMAKGVRKGYLSTQLTQEVKKAYKGIVKEFVTVTELGLVNLNKNCSVAGLGPDDSRHRDGSFEYYISEPIIVNDGKGVGAFILASAEVEKM